MKRYLTLILLSVITLNTYAQSEAGYEKKRSPWLFKKHVWFQDKTTFSDTATFEAPVMVQKIVFSDSTEQTTAGNGVSDSDSSSWTYQLLGGIGDQGTILWNTDDETIDLIQNGSTLQIGQEIQLPCINLTGATIPNGKIVMYAGGSGASGNIKVKPYSYPYPPAYIVGVTTYDAPQGAKVKVTTFGKIRNFDTELIYGTLTDSIIYVDSTGNYTYEPDPDFIVPIGTLVSNETASGANNGTISIRFIPLNYAKVDHGELAYKWGNHANAGYLTSEVDGSVTNEIELTPDELSAVQGASSPSAVNVFLTADDVAEMGGGDMLKATYDSDADNIVDNAENLNNQPASYYLNRNTHTGTQTAATISDFDIEVSNNTNVSANTTAKHTHSNSTYINSIDQNVSTTGAPYFSFITNFSGKWYSAGANIWESTRQGYNILFRPRKFGYAETTMELDTNLTTFYTNLKFNYGSSVFKVGNADTLATKAYARSVSNSGGSGLELTSNELAAVNGANSPSVNNVFATINDLPVLGSGDSLTLFSLIDVTIGSYKDTNIVLRFNRELSQHTGIGFAVRIDGVQQYIQSWYLDNANDPYFGILLNMYGQPIYRESKVEISYTKHANTAYRVKDLAGNELENFGWRGVINNSSTSPVSGSGLSESEVRNIVNDSLNAMRSADRVFTGSVDVSGPFSTAWQQLTYSSTLTVDYSTGAPNKHITLTGNPTISISNLPYGSSWLLIYNGASARTISIGTGWGTKWNSLSLDLTSGGYSLVQFVKSPLETHYYVSVNEN